jgi:hypothetical protein
MRADQWRHRSDAPRSIRRHRCAQGCRSCSCCGRHRARRHFGNASGSASIVSSTIVTIKAPLFRQTKFSARSPCCSMTSSSSPQRPVRVSDPSSASIASRRTVRDRVLARRSRHAGGRGGTQDPPAEARDSEGGRCEG